MYNYALLTEHGQCHTVIETAESRTTSSTVISLASYDQTVLGKRWSGSEWISSDGGEYWNGTEWTEWPTENNDPTGDELILQNITAALVDQAAADGRDITDSSVITELIESGKSQFQVQEGHAYGA